MTQRGPAGRLTAEGAVVAAVVGALASAFAWAFAWAFVGAAMVLAGACGAVAQPASPLQVPYEAVRLALPVPGADASVLSVSVQPLRSPMPAGLHFLVQLRTGDKPADVLELGRLALHPSDSPGTFFFRVSAQTLAALTSRVDGAVLVLVAARSDGLPQDFEAPLLAVRAQWLREPR